MDDERHNVQTKITRLFDIRQQTTSSSQAKLLDMVVDLDADGTQNGFMTTFALFLPRLHFSRHQTDAVYALSLS